MKSKYAGFSRSNRLANLCGQDLYPITDLGPAALRSLCFRSAQTRIVRRPLTICRADCFVSTRIMQLVSNLRTVIPCNISGCAAIVAAPDLKSLIAYLE